jgi:acyl carrier protein
MNPITEKLKATIADIMEWDEPIDDQADLVSDLGMASIDFVELTVAIEKKFGVAVPIEVLSNATTVHSLADWIAQRTATAEEVSVG